MDEPEAIFRNKLVAIVSELHEGAGRDAAMNRALGGFAGNLVIEAKARNWVDLRDRADATTYNSLVLLLQAEAQKASARKDTTALGALNILGISLVARTQNQPDLATGIEYVDRHIQRCIDAVHRPRTGTPSQLSPAH